MVQEARASLPYGRVVLNDWLCLHCLAVDQLRAGTHHRLAFAMAIHVLSRRSDYYLVGVRYIVHDATRSHQS